MPKKRLTKQHMERQMLKNCGNTVDVRKTRMTLGVSTTGLSHMTFMKRSEKSLKRRGPIGSL